MLYGDGFFSILNEILGMFALFSYKATCLFSIDRIVPYIPYILLGLKVTLIYVVFSLFFGFIVGAILTFLRLMYKPLAKFVTIYVSIFRGTPLILQLGIIYYGGNTIINISPFFAGILAFSLNSGAYVSEIFRSGFNSIPKGQYDAIKALGVPKFKSIKDLLFPQAIRNIIPSLVNEAANLLKESALVSTIAETDMFRRAQLVAAKLYTYFEPLIFVGFIYYIITLAMSLYAQSIEKKYAANK